MDDPLTVFNEMIIKYLIKLFVLKHKRDN